MTYAIPTKKIVSPAILTGRISLKNIREMMTENARPSIKRITKTAAFMSGFLSLF